MSCCSVELSLANLVLLGALVFAVKKLIAFYQNWKIEKMLEKWDNSPKDKVLLHTTARCKTLPSASPFAIKLESYLRLANVPYELETADAIGPKGKLPWLTYNGTHVADSHLCIQFLNKKLGINLDKGKSEENLAVARACRIVLEDHFLWGIIQYRWVENIGAISQIIKFPTLFKLLIPSFGKQLKERMVSQGIGKHTPTEIYKMTGEDLHTVSKLLGNKKFFGGDEPCEDDCAIFGMVAQALWGMPGSAIEKIAHDELPNLKPYCERMIKLCWPDWENCIDKS